MIEKNDNSIILLAYCEFVMYKKWIIYKIETKCAFIFLRRTYLELISFLLEVPNTLLSYDFV